jgi:hypothetical protein
MVAAGRTEAEIEEMLAKRHAGRDPSVAESNRRSVVAFAREYGVPLCAHDDATLEQVKEAHDDGCVIAEFPVTLAAASAARGYGMAICMGGPNFVRGGSHSGNLSARACAEHDLLDILASDYVPLSMLRSAFMLIDDFGWSPQKALATVAAGPARSLGLDDRGEIAVGQRADLVRVSRRTAGWPVPAEVWRQGARGMSARYAIYYAPPADTALWRKACAWLGRDAVTGQDVVQPHLPALAGLDIPALTADPRGYGFHATLKAPFELAAGRTEDELLAAAERFARSQPSFILPIVVAALGRFLAFRIDGPSREIEALHGACMHEFEPYRAPLRPADVERRRKAQLSAEQDARLVQWGYP